MSGRRIRVGDANPNPRGAPPPPQRNMQPNMGVRIVQQPPRQEQKGGEDGKVEQGAQAAFANLQGPPPPPNAPNPFNHPPLRPQRGPNPFANLAPARGAPNFPLAGQGRGSQQDVRINPGVDAGGRPRFAPPPGLQGRVNRNAPPPGTKFAPWGQR